MTHVIFPCPYRRSRACVAIVLAALTGCASSPPAAPSAPTPPPAAAASAAAPSVAASASAKPTEESSAQRFADWVATFRATAHAQGIDDATLAAAFDPVLYLPRVIELDRAQPEFVRPVWSYLDTAVSSQRIAMGRERLQQVRIDADGAAARYGVPPSILIAIWGIESNYGSNYGDIPTIDALATLAFDGRRETWARGELMTALRILQRGDIDRAHMIGSWAGAMGQTQFLPSNFVAYAVDADGDGRRDIWGSMADVLASTANFLARSGWRAGEPWGGEVRLPAGYDIARADGTTQQSSAQWTAEGVRSAVGDALPECADAALLLPAGARGPAFLTCANFRAILRYNNSTSYALAVGLLSQAIDGGPRVQAAWPRDLVTLRRSQLQALQSALNARGYDSGTPDGLLGPATRDALRRYQRSVGLPPDGYPTSDLLDRLQAPP